MTATSTVCLKGRLHDFGPSLESAPHVAYVGRSLYQGGWRLAASPFANPFKAQKVGGAARAVELYRAHLREHPALVERARRELRGLTLGCWCPAGSPCHAAALARVCDADLADLPGLLGAPKGRPVLVRGVVIGDRGAAVTR